MRWERGRRSTRVEDRRGGRPLAVGGGLGTLLLLLAAWYFGIDPAFLLQQTGPSGTNTADVPGPSADDPLADFVSVVLADTEDTWTALFAEAGRTYQLPNLVLFTDVVNSGCGMAQAAVGPFYCPADQRVYIDLGFYQALRDRFGAPGDFAQAYVIAHEIGHHVQNLLGTSARAQRARESSDEVTANDLSVRLELQADCYAGVWAGRADRARQILEAGDVEEALTAASAIGDDRLQMRSRGYVAPDSFTHGSAEQRARWFQQGLTASDPAACDTFATARL